MRHPPGAPLGGRALWLSRLVADGAISRGGLLARPVWDPEERRWHTPADDAERDGWYGYGVTDSTRESRARAQAKRRARSAAG